MIKPITQQVIQVQSSRSLDLQDAQATPWETYTATWYSPSGGVGDGLITKTGVHVKQNFTIAVDPRIIPLNSIVEVQFADGSKRLFKATDTGSAIKGRHIDIFDYNNTQCLQNGKQQVKLRILARG